MSPRTPQQTVLVVDDDVRLLDIYEMTLSRAGFTVLKASNGEEGVAMAVDKQPDLILLDIIMPDVDGLETLKRLKGEDATSSIPVVLLTNLPEESVLDQGMTLGALDYLLKVQFQPQELLTRVESFFKRLEEK